MLQDLLTFEELPLYNANGTILFKKLERIASVVKIFKRAAMYKYNDSVKSDFRIQNYIKNACHLSQDELFDLSYKLEPRKS